jgi:hypothetical protein
MDFHTFLALSFGFLFGIVGVITLGLIQHVSGLWVFTFLPGPVGALVFLLVFRGVHVLCPVYSFRYYLSSLFVCRVFYVLRLQYYVPTFVSSFVCSVAFRLFCGMLLLVAHVLRKFPHLLFLLLLLLWGVVHFVLLVQLPHLRMFVVSVRFWIDSISDVLDSLGIHVLPPRTHNTWLVALRKRAALGISQPSNETGRVCSI